jgi:hypothetical protein
MTRLTICTALVGGYLSFAGPPSAEAGSFDRVSPSAEDVARELGMEISKVVFRWETPVFLRLQLQVKAAGIMEVRTYTTSSTEPLREHPITFSIKNLDVLRDLISLPPAPVNEAVELTAWSPATEIRALGPSPFAAAPLGQLIRTQRAMQSREEVPLNFPVPIMIKSGPYTAEQSEQVKDLAEEFILADAFVHLSATFSATPFPPEE